MGWLGLCLIFVGIALFSNGLGALIKLDSKSSAFINAVTGLVLVGGNFIALGAHPTDALSYNNIAAGFLFGFTYIFIAANHALKLDLRAFGNYSVCVAIFAGISAAVCFSTGVIPLGLLWSAWAVLWLEGFLELSCKITALGKIFPALSILEGIFAAFIPGLMMVFDVWPV